MDRLTVYTFDINNLGKFRRLWDMIRNSSVVPTLYDHDEFVRHISQAHLKDISDSLEAHPTQEMIQMEKDVHLLELRNRNYPDAVVPYLSAKNGVVNLKLFMADEPQYNFLSSELEKVFCSPIATRGHFLYPPGGFIEWHTNIQHSEGWRMYIVNVDREGQSFFRYVDPICRELKTIWDFRGALHIFHVGKERPFWHCVKSVGANRWSRGFLIPEDWRQVLLSG